MKIVYLITKFAPITGGGESHIELLAEQMTALGHDVEVITACHGKRKLANFPYKVTEIAGFGDEGISFKGIKSIALVLQESKAELIHLVNYESLFYFALAGSKKPKSTYVFSAYNTPLAGKRIFGGIGEYELEKVNVRKLLKDLQIRSFVANSNVFLRGLKSIELSEVEIELIHFGIDTSVFCPKASVRSDSNSIKLLCTSRFIARKGIEYLIKAMDYLPNNFKLYLTGSGMVHDAATHRMLITEANKNKSQIILSEKRSSLKELIKFYQSADIFIMPSQFEGFGLAALEAMACGVPVVATQVPGLREFVHHEKTGLTLPYGNAKHIARAVKRLAEDALLRDNLINNALSTVRVSYDVRRMARAYENFYKKARQHE